MVPRRFRVVLGLAIVGLVIALAMGAARSEGAASGASASTAGGTLEMWLGGDLTQATPGSAPRKWLDQQIKRFQAQNPGWKIKISFLSYDNATTSARLQAAFSSHNVPDVINQWGGQFATTWAPALLPLNTFVKKTPGLYASMPEALWGAECVPNFNCAGGKNSIIGVPWNAGTYLLFYNKALFRKAGISKPPATYDQLFADCKILSAKGIIPVSMGATDGYDTSNDWTSNLVSTLGPGDMEKILSRKMPYDSPKLVAALEPILKLTSPSTKCTNPNALGQDQLHGVNDFQSGKAAMAPYYPAALTTFEHAIGANNLGVARQPVSGHGPLLHVRNGWAGTPTDGWLIPKDAKNAEMAWKFIQLASDSTAQLAATSLIGLPPANTKAAASLKDPAAKFAAKLAGNPAIPELDQLMPNSYALFLYRQLALAQEGKQSAAQALHAVEQYAKANPIK
jgi:ABC-type glycerol-3-phosphate transport system substrate-binding protein